ncbi:MAG TPA: serine/threonine-protein kinase [Kofleriaceae bacterium]|nr:serine/threonine-protein kinase [Kofleriaceae bacterium]
MASDDPVIGTAIGAAIGAREPQASEVGDTLIAASPPSAPATPATPAAPEQTDRARVPVSVEKEITDAFAATMAPPPSTPRAPAPRPPVELPSGTSPPGPPGPPGVPGVDGPPRLDTDSLQTLDSGSPMAAAIAAATAALPPLPVVSASHYRPEREIARGGMGRIVAAEDQRLGRRVALKELLDPAGEQLTRFQREALITARLQHPGIVPVYEAGRWPSGEPFFAMKLVSGRPLDRVIADTRTLDERLALLPRIAAAADAIAYAHSHRVVHRDLKPANVLIGDFGETVVIDWGLAKDLDQSDGPESASRLAQTVPSNPAARQSGSRKPAGHSSGSSTLTVAGAVMGTPAYMAPEQARGEPVDQRADVFALGAMLYHLLAGVPPYNARTATDVIAAAALGKVIPLDEREQRAPRELIAIVERAMSQVPSDRYPHAGELADELRRFTTGQLVSAHRYTALQRVGRFVRRHRAAVAISTVAVITIALGGTLAVRRIVEERDNADRERTLAVTRRAAAEQLIDDSLGDMKDRLTTIGRLDLLANLGSEIRNYYDAFSKLPGEMSIDDLKRMAAAIDIVGQAERDSGQTDRAMKTWSDVRARLAAAVDTDTSQKTRPLRMKIARLDFQIGTIHQLRGKRAQANLAYQQAKTEYAKLLDEVPGERAILLGAAENHDRIGDLLRNDGKIDEAFDEYAAAKAMRERAAAQTSSRPSEEVMALSTSHMKLGSIYLARGESAVALAEYRTSLRLRESLIGSQPDNVEIQEKLLEIGDVIAELQRTIGDLTSAAETYQHAIPTIDALVRRDPANTAWRRQRGNLLADLGFTLLDSGELKAGDAQLTAAIESQKELLLLDPKNTSWIMDLSQSYTRAGDGKIYLGLLDEGMAHYKESLELRAKLAKREPTHVPYPRAVAWAYLKLGNGYAYRNELDRAIEAHERALEIRAKLTADAPAQVGFKNELASSEITLGRLLAQRDGKRAGDLVAAGLARARALVATDAISQEWKRTLVQGLLAQAELARSAPQPAQRAARKTALAEALTLAEAAAARVPQNVHWAGFVAEAQAGLAELAAASGDARGAAAAWKAVRDRLAPLAAKGRLPAPRRPLLDRAVAAVGRAPDER